MSRPDRDQQARYWRAIPRRRDPSHPAVVAFAASKLGLIRAALPPTATTMLEVGAGNGYFSQHFAEVFDLTAVDFSPTMLGMNPLPAERKIVGDAENLPFETDSFDVVFAGNLLHHLADPERAVREMARVARHQVILIEPNARNPLMFLFGLLKPEERGALKFTLPYLRRLGAAAGLQLRASAVQGIILPNKTPAPLVPLLRPFERPLPLGFYCLAVFDVAPDPAPDPAPEA